MKKIDEVEKELELSKYLEEWLKNNYSKWRTFYHEVGRNKENGIYLLNGGRELMQLLHDIMGIIEEKFWLPNPGSHLIPAQFASVDDLIQWLKVFKQHACDYKSIITNNSMDNDIISEIWEMVNEIEQVTDRCEKIYGYGEMPKPYRILREKLFDKDIDGFVNCVNGLLKGVPYLCRKEKFNECHFQIMLQMLLMVLGFEPTTEQPLSDGRIDMVIKLDVLTYIFEFKYTKGTESKANEALQQIKEKGYAELHKLTSQEIIGVGISFSGVTKNINDKVKETLYKEE